MIPKIEYHNTICNDTLNRQLEIESIAKRVEYVVVIGGKGSSNTKKLAEIANKYCKNVQLVDDGRYIDFSSLIDVNTIAFFSGASTPKNSIDAAIEKLTDYCNINNLLLEIINNPSDLN